MRVYDTTSSAESIEVKRSGRKFIYSPVEKIHVVELENFPLLGKFTAFRFVEWVLKNPGGLVALPTGRTPEYFIKWVTRILHNWNDKNIREVLDAYGIDRSRPPDMKSLRFVQIDEFYPMDASQHNSFHHYVSEFYIKGFGLDASRALVIDATFLGLPSNASMSELFPDFSVDLSLRVRQTSTDLEKRQKDVINRVDSFCTDYESRIRDLGGIGFFLGGIGPDGHVAFNVRGSSFYSVTRLTATNYETQAAAAADLGGVEISRNRLVITIGLETITCNSSATAIIIAAGDAKASVVRQAIEEKKHQQYPASALQDLENSRFYLTRGAASLLTERRLEDFERSRPAPDEAADEVAISVSLLKNKSLLEITRDDFSADPRGRELLQDSPQKLFAESAYNRIVRKIERGLEPVSGLRFLHTEPHQDDVMLAYLPYIYHLVRDPDNKHFFANLTSGFTSVSNRYVFSILKKSSRFVEKPQFAELLTSGYFVDPSRRMEDVYKYLDGSAAKSQEQKDEAEACRFLRNLVELYGSPEAALLQRKALEEYFLNQYPGAKDPPDVQVLKGSLREWEVELLWAYFGIESSNVYALRLGFYQGDVFGEEPRVERDVEPILELLRLIRPDVVTVAFDPEGSGPDTHYKALQAVAGAVRLYEKEASSLRIWGYRNVWYRFKISEANVFIPVSLNTLSLLHSAFMNCFGSQSSASFPSYEHDGPFSELAQKIFVEQYRAVKTCLGQDFFLSHTHPRLRAARGMIFLKEMDLPEFYAKVRELRTVTEGS